MNLKYFKGELCEFSNCLNQPSSCTTFGPTYCSDAAIAIYCPQMCQQAICKCGFDSCLNSGIFIANSCSCFCPAQYTGTRCESLVTASSTTTNAILTTTTSACSLLPCLNGAKQNTVTCKCECKFILNFIFVL